MGPQLGEEITSEYDPEKVAEFLAASDDPFVRGGNCCQPAKSKMRQQAEKELKEAFGITDSDA